MGRSKADSGPKDSSGSKANDAPVRSSDSPRRIDDAVAEAIGSVDNAPSLGMHHAGMSIDGYSRAAVQTYWRIAELKIGFDLGLNRGTSWLSRGILLPIRTWIISQRYPLTLLVDA